MTDGPDAGRPSRNATYGKEIDVHVDDDGVRLTLTGRIGIARVGALHAAAVEACAEDHPVVVDMAQVEHIDSAATQVLLVLRRELELAGLALDIEGLPDVVRSYLDTAGLGLVLVGANAAAGEEP